MSEARQLTLFDVPHTARVPYQHGSASSRAGAENIRRRGVGTVDGCILEVLREAGPRGMTIEAMTERVCELRGKPTKETTVAARVCGREPALGDAIEKAAEPRLSRSGVMVGVYRLRSGERGEDW